MVNDKIRILLDRASILSDVEKELEYVEDLAIIRTVRHTLDDGSTLLVPIVSTNCSDPDRMVALLMRLMTSLNNYLAGNGEDPTVPFSNKIED